MHLLQLDASARPGRVGTQPRGSYTRYLSHRFVTRWRAASPDDTILYRDLGADPPGIIDGNWIHAAFASPERQEPWMADALAESDRLIAELQAADVLVLGIPLYNFSMPAAFKAWIDNVVRLGKTFAINQDNPDHPYRPLLDDRPRHAIILSARGGFDMDEGAPQAHLNHLEPSVRTALAFIGIERVHTIAVEYQEVGGDRLAASLRAAEAGVDRLVDELLAASQPFFPLAATR